MSSFLTADTHFGHANIIRFCKRPFASVDDMKEQLVRNWNSVVKSDRDLVWHVGDFGMSLPDKDMAELFGALNGRKRLVIGNHDVDRKGRVTQALARLPWDAPPTHYAEIKHNGHRIVLNHYAGLVWNGMHYGSLQAFGHSHGGLPGLPGAIDVGVDAQGYKPISVDEFVRQALESKERAREQTQKVISCLQGRLEKNILARDEADESEDQEA